ncbi:MULTISPECIES: hypothetical protein [Deinococcus]|uniref:Lipoprotein n=1 Tax=Deinococcus rufus TaxID=2136097 RepID=A0ABV7Z3V5_9DEIO|nr:hypothetical protein [Deinococcus sp. AB2017081]WQE95996.1 hypothetical protein U2P90_03645 [Deinococcus sp. AB2017081]
MRFLLTVPALALLLAACAPATTGPTLQVAAPPLFRRGDTLLISGRDQNEDALSGTIVLSSAPVYRSSSDSWRFDARGGYVILAGPVTGGPSQFWDTSDPRREKACIVFSPVSQDAPVGTRRLTPRLTGVGIAGSTAELKAVFAKLSGSGTKLTGGVCTVTRK